MTVNEAIVNLLKLQNDGHGELPLYVSNAASGVTSEVWHISDTPRTVDKYDDGDLCQLEVGTPYANISVER